LRSSSRRRGKARKSRGECSLNALKMARIKLFLFLSLFCVIKIVNPRRVALNIVKSTCINGPHLLLQWIAIFFPRDYRTRGANSGSNICAALPQSLASNISYGAILFSARSTANCFLFNGWIEFLVFTLTSGDAEGHKKMGEIYLNKAQNQYKFIQLFLSRCKFLDEDKILF